ncbi:flavin-containing monooxygenase [Marinobacter confluentis]|uniref:NAD(P)/FAD-dependent oxidoreductase n=1 Tax=Marinobacter confluentis TaxID=1697557 RepID=A0A4Z1C1V9_9GAMM|nr:NAD(P)/FAD-dependent oxidoreductase [Marinobacter confluentis]TGN38972.1 NAD(P)/FAD-dependent oxidoreductase [Marinobacter confluentis]
MIEQHTDVLIVGAGVSGIGMACHLRRDCPGKSFTILERRDSLGGTWDLFRYPGIRSDSDMYTFGFSFRPWTGGKVLADGPSIKRYLADTAEEYDVTSHIRFGLALKHAEWSSENACWRITAEREATGEPLTFTANFLIGCTGYYNYDAGYKPDFPGEEVFKGQVVHPQHWPEHLDYKGKQVVVIGSGATAVTLVPKMAEQASHVTMLQRSPTYLMPLPSDDRIARFLQRTLPSKLAYRLIRARNVTIARLLFNLSRKRPQMMRRWMLKTVEKQLGNKADMRHFTPSYNPWDQRLCVVKDGDLFRCIREGSVSMATDHIERFTETGIRLKSGQQLDADIIIPATGLDIQMLGGAELIVDGEPVILRNKVVYKNVMIEGVPNAGMVFGYTNLSWTLKVDIAAEYLCRVLNHMEATGQQVCVAQNPDGRRADDTVMGGLDSGYIRRADDRLPRQGLDDPWRVTQNYKADVKSLRFGPIDDGYLRFTAGISSRPGISAGWSASSQPQ